MMEPWNRHKTVTSSSDNNKNSEIRKYLPDNSDSILESKTDVNEKLSVLLLPDEILLYIYSFLSPMDLISLTKLGNERLAALTNFVREVNLSSCRRANPEHISEFFTGIRVKDIQKLNFSYCLYMEPSEIAHLICQCNNLTSLTVVECGLTHENIVKILQKCEKLEELAWNVVGSPPPLDITFSNLKRVHLFCYGEDISLNLVCFIIRSFPEIKNVWIHFASDFISVFPFIGLWLWSFFVTDIIPSRDVTLIVNSVQCNDYTRDLQFLRDLIKKEWYADDGVTDPHDLLHNRIYNNPPYLQIRTVPEDISLLSSGPFDAYSTISLILKCHIRDHSDRLIKCLKEIAGDKLRHFSLQSEEQSYRLTGKACVMNIFPMGNVASVVCDVLEEVFLTSKYITVLNLTTVHFKSGSPIEAITQLKYLKVLNIPSCAFGSCTKVKNFKRFELSNIVSCCPVVENFALNCCEDDKREVTSDELVCIKDWSFLKHLSIYSLFLHSCQFLQNVADSCMQLQSLSLISSLSTKSKFKIICLYITDVIYLLKKAKNLRLIRINDDEFCPMFDHFWPAIGESVNLEGICINTKSGTYVDIQTVIREIKKLKYLHMFHFYAPETADSLYSEARKCMQENSIKNIKVEKIHCSSTFRRGAVGYNHKLPRSACNYLHLKDINIF